MALLTGSLYKKKTYGRTIFGDLVQAADGGTEEKADAKAKKTAGSEESAVQEEAPTEQPTQTTAEEAEMFGARDHAPASDVKVTWKSAGGKNKRPTKDFFTPKDESGEPDVDTEKEAPGETAEKRTKKKTIGPPGSFRARASYPAGKSQQSRSGSKTITKPAAKDSGSKDETQRKENKQDKKAPEEPSSDKSGDESEAEDNLHDFTEEPSRQVLETVVEESDEDLSENSEEIKKSPQPKQTKKPIVIKTTKPNRIPEKVKVPQAEDGQSPLEVLHPDAIVNLKRELARKGIIRSYPDADIQDQPATEHIDVGASDPTANNEISEISGDVAGNPIDDTPNDNEEDTKDGFKTNKSFEIRRLQAKAERDREEKRPVFSKPKLSKGGKLTVAISKTNEDNDTNYDEHRKNWIRKKPKSILKPRSGVQDAREYKKQNDDKRRSATVRIREPEYDYKLFSAGESDESSDSVPSQSSSVFGYRPNSATSLSTESSVSFGDDGSLDWEAVQDLDDEDAFYRASALGRTVHDIYDDIDRLNPSRLTNIRTPVENYDAHHHSRAASADYSYVDRSSLHVLRGSSRHSRRSARNNSAVRAYEDKPLQLFDAMRYADENRKRKGILRNASAQSTRPDSRHKKHSEAVPRTRMSSRQARRTPSSRQSSRHLFSNGAVTFGPNMIPIPKGEDITAGISEKEWVNRAQKFFATLDAGRRKQAEQRKSLKKPGILRQFGRKFKRKKKKKITKSKTKKRVANEKEYILPPLCYCESCPSCCSIFFCETQSTWSNIVLIFLPTAVISTIIILAIFWGLGIFSIT